MEAKDNANPQKKEMLRILVENDEEDFVLSLVDLKGFWKISLIQDRMDVVLRKSEKRIWFLSDNTIHIFYLGLTHWTQSV